MTVRELIEKLSQYPDDLDVDVTSYDTEWGIEEHLKDVEMETEWNGVRHVNLYFDGEYKIEKTPAEKALDPKPQLFRCEYCGCQSWRPMVVPVTQGESSAANEDDGPGRNQDDADPRSQAGADAG